MRTMNRDPQEQMDRTQMGRSLRSPCYLSICYLSICALSILSFGCAATGALMEIGGTAMSLQGGGNAKAGKSLADAGKSFKRVAEVEDFSAEEKYYTGRSVAANLLAGSDLSEDEGLQEYVNQVGQTVAQASGYSDLHEGWHFILLKDASPGAFAAPGGLILVTEGLLKLCESEDELAGVLAHEVAHISIDHPTQAISAANKKNALASLAQFGFEAANKDKKGAQALGWQFKSVVKDVAKGVTQGYDRAKEKEADLEAVRMLVDLGYDPRGLKRVLEKMKKGSKSHGDPKERAKLVEQAAFEAEPVPALHQARTERFKKALGL
jgi:beta-barrel assembly-enhancing protease